MDFFLLLLVAGFFVGCVFLKAEDKDAFITIVRVDRREWLEPYPFYAVFITENGERGILHRVNIIENSPEVWSEIYEGQRLFLYHYALAWGPFAIYHRDILKPLMTEW